MGTNKMADENQCSPNIESVQEVEKFDNSPRMSSNEISEFLQKVKLECEDSILLGENYNESIIGYDYNTKAIIYDGDKILNRMADDKIEEEIEDGIEIIDNKVVPEGAYILSIECHTENGKYHQDRKSTRLNSSH